MNPDRKNIAQHELVADYIHLHKHFLHPAAPNEWAFGQMSVFGIPTETADQKLISGMMNLRASFVQDYQVDYECIFSVEISGKNAN